MPSDAGQMPVAFSPQNEECLGKGEPSQNSSLYVMVGRTVVTVTEMSLPVDRLDRPELTIGDVSLPIGSKAGCRFTT